MILTLQEFLKNTKTNLMGRNYGKAIGSVGGTADFWDSIIGTGIFDRGFLEYIMCRVDYGIRQKHITENNRGRIPDKTKKIGGGEIAVDVSGTTILGVIMYSQTGLNPCMEKFLGVWEINLVARTKYCPDNLRGVGKKLIRWLEARSYIGKIPVKRIVLIDDSSVPGYYQRLGYNQHGKNSWKWRLWFRTILGVGSEELVQDMYYKKI